MTPQSAKAKGRKLQKKVAETLVEASSRGLVSEDCRSTSSGANGEDILMSPKARSEYPVVIECKNVAAFVGYRYLKQAESNITGRGVFPVAVVGANREKRPIVMIYLDDFLKLKEFYEKTNS